MSDRLADFLINLAEDAADRAAFEAAPETEMAARGFSAEEQAAVLSGDDAQIIALAVKPAAPVVSKILGGTDEQPEAAPVVAKILGGMDEQSEDEPIAAKILGGMDEQPEGAPVVAKILGGFDEKEAPRRVARRA